MTREGSMKSTFRCFLKTFNSKSLIKPLALKKMQRWILTMSTGLWKKQCSILDDIAIDPPKCLGKNVKEHFENIAIEQSIDYFRLAKKIVNATPPSITED